MTNYFVNLYYLQSKYFYDFSWFMSFWGSPTPRPSIMLNSKKTLVLKRFSHIELVRVFLLNFFFNIFLLIMNCLFFYEVLTSPLERLQLPNMVMQWPYLAKYLLRSNFSLADISWESVLNRGYKDCPYFLAFFVEILDR